jgi:hypothetical protein
MVASSVHRKAMFTALLTLHAARDVAQRAAGLWQDRRRTT